MHLDSLIWETASPRTHKRKIVNESLKWPSLAVYHSVDTNGRYCWKRRNSLGIITRDSLKYMIEDNPIIIESIIMIKLRKYELFYISRDVQM